MESLDKPLDKEDIEPLIKYFEVLAEIERGLGSTDGNSVATEL